MLIRYILDQGQRPGRGGITYIPKYWGSRYPVAGGGEGGGV